jgi:integrase
MTRSRVSRAIRDSHILLKKALKQAVRWRLVRQNVLEDVEPPELPTPRVEVWSASEARAFLAVAEGDAYGALWLVALATGMRKGELLALRWCDIDPLRSLLQVERNVALTENGYSFGEPRAKTGRRMISLPSSCLTVLDALRSGDLSEAGADNSWQLDTTLVFSSTTGTLIDQRNVDRQFAKLVRVAGLKRITFHGLRHTHAALLLQNGVNVKTVSARLGHASAQVTLATYAHLLLGTDEQAAAAIEMALTGKAEPVQANRLVTYAPLAPMPTSALSLYRKRSRHRWSSFRPRVHRS